MRKRKVKNQNPENAATPLKEEKTKAKGKHIAVFSAVITACKRLRKFDKWLGSCFQKSALGQIVLAVVLATAVAVLSSGWNGIVNKNTYIDEINNLCLGLSQSYVDSALGEPSYLNEYKEDEITESIYISECSIVRCYYAEGRLVAFFVTGRPGQEGVFGKSRRFEKFVNDKSLGEYSFTDIYRSPLFASGSFQNGTGYMYYNEEYYYASSGLYYQYYFMMMEYGFFKCEPTTHKKYMEDEEIESAKTDVSTLPYWYNRTSTYPNTYGICEFKYESIVSSLAVSYSNYDFTDYFESSDDDVMGNYFFGPYSDDADKDVLLFFSARKPRYHGVLITPEEMNKKEEL